jgi:hypothetical protein
MEWGDGFPRDILNWDENTESFQSAVFKECIAHPKEAIAWAANTVAGQIQAGKDVLWHLPADSPNP